MEQARRQELLGRLEGLQTAVKQANKWGIEVKNKIYEVKATSDMIDTTTPNIIPRIIFGALFLFLVVISFLAREPYMAAIYALLVGIAAYQMFVKKQKLGKKLKITMIAVFGFVTYFYLTQLKLIFIIVVAIFAVIVFFIYRYVSEEINKKIAAKNAENEEYNRTHVYPVIYDYKRKLEDAVALVNQRSHGWYPSEFLSEEGIGKIIHTIASFRADTIKEAINLLDEKDFKQQMLNSQSMIVSRLDEVIDSQSELATLQKETNRMMHYNNVLQLGNLINGLMMRADIKENTAAVRSVANRPINVNVQQRN